ncbi:hypothetical protein ACP6PL_06335, partial [Dapis sp. BLCC M126]|uniref:hypothetical protein n=1 Tax=Dapis sp. BLCC M126 TaxID=3400189 RepID=UPI003CF8DCE4
RANHTDNARLSHTTLPKGRARDFPPGELKYLCSIYVVRNAGLKSSLKKVAILALPLDFTWKKFINILDYI